MRFSWMALAILLAVSFWGPRAGLWLAACGIPWTLGAIILFRNGSSQVVSAASDHVLRSTAVQVSLAVQLFVGWWLVHLFTIHGALLYLVWGAALWLVLTLARKEEWLVSVLRNGTTVVVAVLVAAVGVELLLRVPALQQRLGTPTELAAWSSRYDGLEKQNVLGIRSPYEDVRRDPETLRILALGDSYTWGDLVADADSVWPARLEAHVHQEFPERLAQVVNMGFKGFTTANEAEWLRRVGWQFDPDLVVVQFEANDALPSYPGLKREGGDWLIPQRRLLPSRLAKGAAGHSALYKLLVDGLNRFLNRSYDYPALLKKLSDPSEPTWFAFRDAIHEMADSASARAVPAVLMIFPRLVPGTWNAGSHPLGGIYERVRNEARSAGLYVLDLTPVFAAENGDPRRWHATPYDSHPNARANAIATAALARYLTERGLLEQAWQHAAQRSGEGRRPPTDRRTPSTH
ncbi:MAG: GDSL-type esterase/lipase family protein [Gemmatimonadales bacterium]